ncbi:MAG: family 16 glycoside hydrolase [Planctomycetota bacterium]|nr:family 16 glycoside hydrolase [Planctomycetota bacterium]
MTRRVSTMVLVTALVQVGPWLTPSHSAAAQPGTTQPGTTQPVEPKPAAATPAVASSPADPRVTESLVPGVTVWAFDIGERLPRRPSIVAGQTPNAYGVFNSINFRDRLDSPYGPLEDGFAGEVRGWLLVDRPGLHQFRLSCDDGAALVINGVTVADTELVPQGAEGGARFTATGSMDLAPGLHRISIPFYEDQGQFRLRLEWIQPRENTPASSAGEPANNASGTNPRTPSADAYALIPPINLRTEGGQTYATSPGPKRWYFGNDPSAPGDGRPLEGVHPAFTLENFRGPDFKPPVGAMAFLPDGRLAITTWDPLGAVYLLSNLNGEAGDDPTQPAGVRVSRFAEGLAEPLGLAVVDGELLVTHKHQVTRLRDTDSDGVADHYQVVASGWPASHNYHEFSFNLVPLQGSLYLTTSVPLRSGFTNYMPGSLPAFSLGGLALDRASSDPLTPGPGTLLKIDPASGDVEAIAAGLRAPNGLGVGPDGELFGCDNQGCWLPASRLNHYRPGRLYGHQTEPTSTPGGVTPEGESLQEPAAAWFPHGEIGNSPSEPVLVPDGIYRRQLLVGDVTHGGIKRVFLERVAPSADQLQNARFQGAVFRFSQGIEAGVNRLAWGPDGCLYVGGIGSNGNWNHKETKFGLQRLRPNANIPFEMLSVESRRDGFLITFTKPVDRALASADSSDNASTGPTPSIALRRWHYLPDGNYGGPKLDERPVLVDRVEISSDARQVFVSTPELARERSLPANTVVYLRLRGVQSAEGEKPWSTEAWYTLNAISPTPGPAFRAQSTGQREPGTPTTEIPPNAIRLSDGTPASLANWRHAAGGPSQGKGDSGPVRWTINQRGELEVDLASGDIRSAESFGDCFLHLEWFAPHGGEPAKQTNANSGVKLQERYEIQILNTPATPHPPKFNEAGSIYRQTAASVNASLGAGVWQTYDIRFRAPRWSGTTKTANARITLWWNGVLVHDDVEVNNKTGMSPDEVPGHHPLLLQAHPTAASGPVRFRNVWLVRE